MNDTLKILFGLLGGLAIFIFGMNMMSECLQKAAGDRMKKILQDELDAGNEINETYQGWKYEDSIMVFLKYSFKAPVKTDLPGISYLELNDPHYWKAEYYEEDSHQTIACDFL